MVKPWRPVEEWKPHEDELQQTQHACASHARDPACRHILRWRHGSRPAGRESQLDPLRRAHRRHWRSRRTRGLPSSLGHRSDASRRWPHRRRERKHFGAEVLRPGGDAPLRHRGRGRRSRRIRGVVAATRPHSRGLGPCAFLAVGNHSIRARWPVRQLEPIPFAAVRALPDDRGSPTPGSRWFDRAGLRNLHR